MSPLAPCLLAGLLAAAPPAPPDANVVFNVAVGPAGTAQVCLVATGAGLRAEPVARALRAVLGTAAVTTRETGPTQLWAAVNYQLPNAEDGAGEFDLAPLFAELRAQGVGRVQVSVMAPGSDAACELGGRSVPSLNPGTTTYQTFHATVPTDLPAPVLTFAFDLTNPVTLPIGLPDLSFDFLTPTPGDPAWLWLLAAVPVGVAAAAWRVRRLAARPGVDVTTLGFRYWRFQTLLPVGTAAAWLTAVAVSGAAPHAGTWLPDPGTAARAVRWAAVYFLPPAALVLLALRIAAPAARRLRELDWPLADITGRTAGTPVVTYAVILVVVLGVRALTDGQPRLGVALMLGALVTQAVVGRRTRRALQLTPVPLTHGELRDRIADLAGRLGVRVPQVGLLPSDRSRLVNAFALAGHGVWLSDRLVREFGRREVDAIAAHELAHLRQFARRRRRAAVGPAGWVIWFVLTFALTAAMTARSFGVAVHAPDWWPPVDWPSLGLAGLLISLHLSAARQSRRREFDADRVAAETTGDAAGLITALTRLTRLTGLPDAWGRWDGLFLTHPPTARRVAALAAVGRLSPEQVATSRALAAGAPDPYPVPPSAVAGATVFSPEFRRRALGRLGWAAIAAAVGVPLVAALLADAVGPGPLADAVLIAGAVLPTVVYALAVNRLATAGGGGLERGVRAKLAVEGIDPAGAVFVSLAPTDEVRVYDGFSQWDVGLLWLAGDRLVYVGEHTRFALPREWVTGLRVGRGLPGWLPTRRAFVSWRDPATGAEETFAVWPGAERSVLRLRRAVHEFASRLRAWRAGEATGAPPAAVADAGPPAFGTVYGVLPRQLVNGPAFLRSLYFVAPLAAGLCVLAGVPFALTVLGGGGYVVAVSVAALAAQLLPYWLARDRRAGTVPVVRALPEPVGRAAPPADRAY